MSTVTRVVLVVLAALIALTPSQAQASAPKPAIQNAALVLKKLEPVNPPSYPNEVFTNRDALVTAVADVLRVMADPAVRDPSVWCTPIINIRILAAGTTAYFDITAAPNPALAQFLRDWDRVAELADCVPHHPIGVGTTGGV